MKVDIYITTKFSGRVTSGTGAYGILLQTEKEGKKYRKEHFAGWKNISYQKLNTRAVVEAIQCMVAPAHESEEEKARQSVEISTNTEISDKETIEQSEVTCPYCSGMVDIYSLDRMFRIHMDGNGSPTGRIERGIYNATIEFDYCPMCGKELANEG